ncbi:uncharacterized protein LOC134263391 [Saccostrea cucullata]|uniref:uncharacterized protein LOC134263391 n=1 Tax=Saccostrea cuccullata TaxID=36930 RepID=UPI002ED4850A
MCIIQLFIPVILSVVECLGQTGCLSSVPTVSNVHRCPGNVSEWVKASERKRCSLVRQNCSSDSEFQYHCLINAEINGMVEVCIPIRRIVGSFCPFYDSKKARIENHYHLSCKEHKFNCPEHYQSNEAYKYQGCYSAVFGQEFTNKTKRGENVNDIQIFQ